MSGLTVDGLVVPTLTEIRESLNAALRSAFGLSIDLGDKSTLGQITGILAERYASLWEMLEAVNSSQDPDKAVGAALEALCALTGTFRPAAAYSTVTLTLTGTPTTVVASGSKASTESTEENFVTLAEATITALDAWADTTPYAVGARVTNNDQAFEATTAGTSAGSGGPVLADVLPPSDPDYTPDDIADGTVVWRYLGEGTGVIDVSARAEETGIVTATARDIYEIETAVSGWESVTNLETATVGRAEAEDGELRLLREQELATGGNSPIDALRAELLEVAGVSAVTIFANNTDVTDADGVPPHSVEALVRGGDDQDIYDALLAGVAAGIGTHGTETGSATDDEGTSHVMKFTRPDEVEIWVSLTVTYDEDLYPTDGNDQIKEAIIDWSELQKTGKNAVASAIVAQAFLVTGVLDVTCLIGLSDPPSGSATLPISLRELAVYATGRIDVTSAAGVP